MLRSLVLAAAALLLSSCADACECILNNPPPLSECEVQDNQVALLVTFKCTRTLDNNVAVAEVVIDKIFENNAGLGLSVGDTTTVSSSSDRSFCGIGADFAPGDQWILFATPTSAPSAQIVGLTTKTGGRRLQQPLNLQATGSGAADAAFDSVFVDGSFCNVLETDLETHLCAGNVIEPTANDIQELMEGCSNSATGVFTTGIFTKTQR